MTMTAGAAWLNETFRAFDEAAAMFIHNLHECAGSWLDPVMEFISLLGKGGIALILLSLTLLVCRRTRRFGTAMCISLALGAIVVNLWLKIVIARPRPYADAESLFYPFWVSHGQHTESDYSFPSGHTNAAFATMVPVFLLGKKTWSWLALVFALLMGVSRVHLMVHFPSDVLGGIITGTLAGIVGTLLTLKIPEDSRWYGWDLRKARTGGNAKGAHEA